MSEESIQDRLMRKHAADVEATRARAREQARHAAMGGYVSTGCLHGDHGYCRAMVGFAGVKRPGECKFCGLDCRCDCHMADEDAC